MEKNNSAGRPEKATQPLPFISSTTTSGQDNPASSEVQRGVLSNAHADLAERLKSATAAAAAAARTAIERSIEAGAILCQARGAIPHGQWALFLKRGGVHERQARRLMQLSRCCLTPDMMSDLGGIGATLDWLASWPDLAASDCLVIWRADQPVSDQFMPVAITWPREADVVDFGAWLFEDTFQWAGRGLRRHGLPLMSCSVLGTKRPSALGWTTLHGQGPQWREMLFPTEGGAA